MRHTDFWSLYKDLDNQLQEELITAIRAHGGEYVFADPEEYDEYEQAQYNVDALSDVPIILASSRYMGSYEDFYVVRVELEEDDFLCVYGVSVSDGGSEEVELDSYAHGQLENILDHIPSTEEVKSVVAPKTAVPILTLRPEDVENIGYDPNMTASQFNELTRLMEKSVEFNMDIYWDALKQACERLELPMLKKSDGDGED